MSATEKTHEQKPNQTTTIIVNAQQKTVEDKELSFEALVSLAYNGSPPSGPNWEFTITYQRGHGNKPQGSLVVGESVKVKEGMIFDVYGTDKS